MAVVARPVGRRGIRVGDRRGRIVGGLALDELGRRLRGRGGLLDQERGDLLGDSRDGLIDGEVRALEEDHEREEGDERARHEPREAPVDGAHEAAAHRRRQLRPGGDRGRMHHREEHHRAADDDLAPRLVVEGDPLHTAAHGRVEVARSVGGADPPRHPGAQMQPEPAVRRR